MADSDDFQALENISNEVDNSQVKILISSHCMKAQTFLLDKLRKQSERQKEICKYISSSNSKLDTEIKLAEQEVKSLNIAIETIKLGNIELNKEHLLGKERKAEIFERTKVGKKKYENLWLTSKERYENIPIVKKFIETKNKNQSVQANINAYINESKRLLNEIKIKKNDLDATDRARVIELAEYLVRERAKMLTKINEYSDKIKEVVNEIQNLEKDESRNNRNVSHDQILPADRKEAFESIKDSIQEDNWCNISKNSEKDPMALPKLHLHNRDLDIFSIKLDQIHKVDSQNTTSIKRTSSTLSNLEENPHKIHKTEDRDNENYISSYFDISLNNKAGNDDKKQHNKNYSEKKLIHILEDIKLDKNETFKIIKNLEANQFQATKCITSKNIEQYEIISNTHNEINKTTPDQKNKSLETEGIEIKLPKTREEDLVDPPSQFIDASQGSQEKKSVSFNIPIETVMSTSPEEVIGNATGTDKSHEKILNSSATSDDSYTAIKDKILKKHNLDLSPQFVYSKSTMHKQEEQKITSKFFESQKEIAPLNMNDDDYNKNIKQDQRSNCDKNKSNLYDNEICPVNENVVISSPKEGNFEIPVEGLLFNHGAQGISDSLNLSISTTGFEDNEDYPHCIDSSILLSPKADIPASVSSSHNNEVMSQEVPNFLTGFRKTALSFFGSTNPSDARPDSGESQGGGFNFAFGNEEKKGRGGFFSMFH